MKQIIRFLFFAPWIFAAASASPVISDCASYPIILPVGATAAELTAARELSDAGKRMTGKNMSIERIEKIDSPAVYVGQSAFIGEKIGVADFSRLQPDEIIIKTVGKDLFISGGRPRGVYYAVNTLLEDVWGVRYWTATETDYPRHDVLPLPQLNIRYAPPLFYREVAYCDLFLNPVFAAHRKINGHWDRIPEAYGGHLMLTGFCHTFDMIFPPQKYFDSHPEYFAEIKGKRQKFESQLCLSNRDMRREFIRCAIAWIRKNPSSLVSISQDDGGGECTCPQCLALTRELGGHNSDLLLDFVNEIAAALEKEFSGITVVTLAYGWTAEPPAKVRPRSNVMVQVCLNNGNYSRPFTDPPNRKNVDMLTKWTKCADKLAVWYYGANFYNFLIPFPNYLQLGSDLPFFVANHAKMFFYNVDNGSGSVGDFVQLRAYLYSKLCWNPQLDAKTTMTDFITGYYGPAAPHIKEYFRILQTEAERGLPLQNATNTDSWLRFDVLMQLCERMDRACASVEGKEPYSWRVRRARLSIAFAFLLRREITDQVTAARYGITEEAIRNRLRECLEVVRKEKAGQYREHVEFDIFARFLKAAFDPEPPPAKIPDEFKSIPSQRLCFFPACKGLLWCRGTLTFPEKDTASLNGNAVRMLTLQSSWWLQIGVQTRLPGRWKAYAGLRADLRPGIKTTGPALTFGLYDSVVKKSTTRTFTGEELAGSQYRYYSLGDFEFNGGEYFYFSPAVNDKIASLHVDHLILVRQ